MDLVEKYLSEETTNFKKLKTINSHVGFGQFLSDVGEGIGFIAKQQIPSPYSFSPTHTVYNWNGKKVIVVETSHKRYEVFEVPGNLIRKTESQAEEEYIKKEK